MTETLLIILIIVITLILAPSLAVIAYCALCIAAKNAPLSLFGKKSGENMSEEERERQKTDKLLNEGLENIFNYDIQTARGERK